MSQNREACGLNLRDTLAFGTAFFSKTATDVRCPRDQRILLIPKQSPSVFDLVLYCDPAGISDRPFQIEHFLECFERITNQRFRENFENFRERAGRLLLNKDI